MSELTTALGLTRAAVTSHLEALRADGFVLRGELRPGARRPSTVYVLTPAADDLFPKTYSDFAALILEEVAQEGTESLRRLLHRVGDRWIARDLPRLEGLTGHERLDRVKEIMAERGFMPVLEHTNAGYVFREHNCPLMRLVAAHPEVCDMVHRWLEILIGTPIRRTQCLRNGDLFSAYVVESHGKR